MSGLKALNLAIRFFVVELGALAAAAYWGLFISPKARIAVPRLAALAIELLLLGLVALGLAAAGPLWLGIAYGAVALVSGVLNFVLEA